MFIGVVRKLRKTTLSLVLSVRPHETIWLTHEGFSWNFICVFFEFLSTRFRFHYNLTRITGTLRESLVMFIVASRFILLRMRNFVVKSCRENQNTHFVLSKFLNSNCCLGGIVFLFIISVNAFVTVWCTETCSMYKVFKVHTVHRDRYGKVNALCIVNTRVTGIAH